MNQHDKKLLQEYKNTGLSPMEVLVLGQEKYDLEREILQAKARIAELEAELKILKNGKHDAIENLAANLANALRQRDAAIEDMRGICYLCKNAKPYRLSGTTMMTCPHINGIASNKQPKCPYFEWRGIKDGM